MFEICVNLFNLRTKSTSIYSSAAEDISGFLVGVHELAGVEQDVT